MAFTQKTFLTKDSLIEPLSNLLKIEIVDMSFDFQDKGSPGNVNQLKILTKQGMEKNYILKKKDNYDYTVLYNLILKPYNLNCPTIYGEININNEGFFVIEYINNDVQNWTKNEYKKSVEWLIYKDNTIKNDLVKISDIPIIRLKNSYIDNMIGDQFDIIKKGIELNIHPNLSRNKENILKLEKTFKDNINLLKREPLTLCHYDYNENNILFHDGQIYVIDWTGPFTGSCLIDLVEILKNTSTEIEGEMKNLYKSQIIIPDFDAKYKIVKDINNLGYLGWLTKRGIRKEEMIKENLKYESLINDLISI